MKKHKKRSDGKNLRRRISFLPISEWLILPKWRGFYFDEDQKCSLNKRIVVILLLLAMLLTCFVCAQKVYTESEKTLPHAIVFRSSKGLGTTFDKEGHDFLSRVSVTQATVTASNPEQRDKVNVYYTEDNYDAFVTFDMIEGSYFYAKEYPQQNRAAVISEKMAIRHYKTTEAVGLKLSVGGTEYTVCGVYRSKEDLLTSCSTNGYDAIYIPYQSAEAALPVHFVLLSTELTEFTNTATSALISKTGLYLFPEHITGYHDLLDLMVFFRKLAVFLMGVTVIVLLCVCLKRNGETAYRFYQTEEQKSNGNWYALKALLFLLLALGIYFTVRFELKIPQSVLPPDNIFDMKHYFELILSAVQSHNAILLYDFYWNYCFAAMTAYAAWMLAAAVLFALLTFKTVSLAEWLRKIYEE